ncbi:MAG: hypothetical protein AAGD06_25330, partial [Acidobacteriota bacterium]
VSRRSESGINARETLFSGKTGPGGVWASQPLPAGGYFLRLEDSESSVWERRDLDVAADSGPVLLTPSFVPIEGKVFLGSEPTAATLWFGGRRSEVSLRMLADEEGDYRGWLPRVGDWKVDVSAIEGLIVRLGPVVVDEREDGRAVGVDLHLPDNRVYGQVVDTSGEGVESPRIVMDWRVAPSDVSTGRRSVKVFGDEQGNFELRGLPEGQVEVWAQSQGSAAESQRAAYSLFDKQELGPLRLVIQDESVLEVRLTTAGNPILDGSVLAEAAASGLVKKARLGERGYEVTLPVGTPFVDLLIAAPGFGARLVRAAMHSGPLSFELQQNGGSVELDFTGVPTAPSQDQVELLASLRLVSGSADFGLQQVLAGLGGVPEPGGHRVRLTVPLAAGAYRVCGTSPARGATCLPLAVVQSGRSEVAVGDLFRQ